jgi:hypothetical protein
MPDCAASPTAFIGAVPLGGDLGKFSPTTWHHRGSGLAQADPMGADYVADIMVATWGDDQILEFAYEGLSI